jgi:hypothetical protein
MIRLIAVAGFALAIVGASNYPRADRSAGRHDHPGRLWLRSGQDTSSWCLRG